MNALAHHFVISTLNKCIMMSTDASPDEPFLTLAGAVQRLYLGYQEIEHRLTDEFMRAEIECRMEDASRALLYYAAHSSADQIITDTYEILENFDASAKAWDRQQRARAKTVVIDNRTTTHNGEPS